MREILISESAWEEMTCLFAPSLVARFPAQDELIVITDIFAGSVNNEFVRFLSRPHFHLLSGLNLPLIIDLLISAAEDDTEKLITEALTNAKESIQYCNQTIASAMTMDKDF
ncbi:PTS sugar transporter subunit IIA [Klebsiella pneumoniae]|uniref:PTS sugar transporter subunit IIA n=1 Tax=Klebsiella pneumoniae TaxID=573 RepID=UPI0020B15E61|nr:PTS sugar transporter [Klebsiella pneumoniae]